MFENRELLNLGNLELDPSWGIYSQDDGMCSKHILALLPACGYVSS